MQFGGSNSHGFAREAKENVEELHWSEREREGERCYLSTRSGNGQSGTSDRWREKRRYKYPLRSQRSDKCGSRCGTVAPARTAKVKI
jgi:hypothetical protein